MRRRLLIATLLGFLFGIACAYMATIRKPIEITPYVLAGAIYTRTLAGFFIGLLDSLLIVKSRKLNAALRGFIIGFLTSIPLALPYGIEAALGFALFGGIYGIITDLIATFI